MHCLRSESKKKLSGGIKKYQIEKLVNLASRGLCAMAPPLVADRIMHKTENLLVALGFMLEINTRASNFM